MTYLKVKKPNGETVAGPFTDEQEAVGWLEENESEYEEDLHIRDFRGE